MSSAIARTKNAGPSSLGHQVAEKQQRLSTRTTSSDTARLQRSQDRLPTSAGLSRPSAPIRQHTSFRVRFSTVVVWSVAVAVPLTYILLLPALSRFDPFGTSSFAHPLTSSNMSISKFLQNAPANGGFAAFSSPVIAYIWLNPLAQGAPFVRAGSLIFTVGWLLSVLIPVGFSNGFAHSIAFGIGVAGTVLFSFALLCRVQRSFVLAGLFVLLLVALVLSASLFVMSDIWFVVAEYIAACLTIVFAPAVNYIGRPRQATVHSSGLSNTPRSKFSRNSVENVRYVVRDRV